MIEPRAYRDAMARYAGHVQIVTTAKGDLRRGVTVTAACSVSDTPGTVLVCLNHSNPNNAIFLESGVFALNSLSAEDQPLADAFSGLTHLTAEERFAHGTWDTIATGAPTLASANAVFDCKLVDTKAMSTHIVLFGEVQGLRVRPASPALVYMDRGYHAL